MNLFSIVVSIRFAASQKGVFSGCLKRVSRQPKIARSHAKEVHFGSYGT